MVISTGLILFGGCGDDGTTTVSASGTDGETTAGSTGPSPTTTTVPGTMSDSMSDTVLPTTGGMSDSVGETTTTGPEETTTGQTTAMIDPDTTTGPDETTTTGPDETTTGETTGDDTTGDTMIDPDECQLAAQHLPCDANSDDPLHAIGLNCTSLGGDYVNNQNATMISNLDFQAPPAMGNRRAWQVARSYGTYIDPDTNEPFWSSREGDKLLMISSGLLPAPNAQGAVIIADGDVYNDTAFGGVWDSNVMPPPMSHLHGSPDPEGFTNCDGVNDCSNTILAQWNLGLGNPEDKMWFHFELTAPSLDAGDIADANGFTFDFAYFSAEFPEYVDSQFNDIFIAWQASEEYTGNITFIDGQPLTVTALWPIDFEGQCDGFLCVNPADPHLAGTGHIQDGGATSWYKATSGVNPGETFLLSFAIFDMGDSTFDTTALIDNWQWDCEGCIPSEVNSCGVAPQ